MKKISATEILLLFYVILMPFSLFTPKEFGINIKLCDFVFPFLFVSFVIEKRKNLLKELKKSSVFFFFLLFIATGAISMFNSAHIRKSVLELARYVYLLALSIIVVSSIESRERFYRLIKTWLFTTGAVLFVGFLGIALFFMDKPGLSSQFAQFSPLDKTFTFFPRAKATFYSPNMLLTYLHVSIVLGIVYFYKLSRKLPIRSLKASSVLGFIIFTFLGAFSTLSRRFSGLLLSLLLILRRFSQKNTLRYLKYAIAAAFVVFLILGFLTTKWQIFPVKFRTAENRKVQFSVNTKFSHHLLPQKVSLRMFIKHPIVGIGIGNYNLKFANFYSEEEITSGYELKFLGRIGVGRTGAIGKKYAYDPHSLYMGTLAEQGALGFFALIFFFGVFYYRVYLKKKDLEYAETRNIAHILTAGLTGFLLNGFTTDILTMRHLWFLMALTFSFISICENEHRTHRT